MNEVSKTRIKALIVLLIVIALVHAVVLAFILPGRNHKDVTTLEEPANEEPAAKEAAAKKAPEMVGRFRKPINTPGFGGAFHPETAYEGNFPYFSKNSRLFYSKNARSGFMVDLSTRNVLWMKNPRQGVPVASMVKMMTLLLTFEALEQHPDWTLDMPIQITAGATKVARTGIIWLDTREKMPLEDLLKAVTIKSANDAAYQVAEFVGGGDVNSFVARMNARAKELDMPGYKFVSPNGLPDKQRGNSLCSAEGMTRLAERLLEYPLLLTWTSTKQTHIRDGRTELTSTNKLINPHWPGVDGMKTGFTQDAGYCLTFSCERNGRRIIGCVTGFPSAARGRDPFVRALIDWGYQRAADIDAGQKNPPVYKAASVPNTAKKATRKTTRKKRQAK